MLRAAAGISAAFIVSAASFARTQDEEALTVCAFARSVLVRAAPGAQIVLERIGSPLGAVQQADAAGITVFRSEEVFAPGHISVTWSDAHGVPRVSKRVAIESVVSPPTAVAPHGEAWLVEDEKSGSRELVWRLQWSADNERDAHRVELLDFEARTREHRVLHRQSVWTDSLRCARGTWELPREVKIEEVELVWWRGDTEAPLVRALSEVLCRPRAASTTIASPLVLEPFRSVLVRGENLDLRVITRDSTGQPVASWIRWELCQGSELLLAGRLLSAHALGTATWSVVPPREGDLQLKLCREDAPQSVIAAALFVTGIQDPEPLRWIDPLAPWPADCETALRWHDRDGSTNQVLALADEMGRLWQVWVIAPKQGVQRMRIPIVPASFRALEMVLMDARGHSLRRRVALERPLHLNLSRKDDRQREWHLEVRDARGNAVQAAAAWSCFDEDQRCLAADADLKIDARGGAWIELPEALHGRLILSVRVCDARGRRGLREMPLEVPQSSAVMAPSLLVQQELANGWERLVGAGSFEVRLAAHLELDWELEVSAAVAPALWAEVERRLPEHLSVADDLAQQLLWLEIAEGWPSGWRDRSRIVLQSRAGTRRAMERLSAAWNELQDTADAERILAMAAELYRRGGERYGPIDLQMQRRLRDAADQTQLMDLEERPEQLELIEAALQRDDESALRLAMASLLRTDVRERSATWRWKRAQALFQGESHLTLAPRSGVLHLSWNDHPLADQLALDGAARRLEIPRLYRSQDGNQEFIHWQAEGQPLVFWRLWARQR